MQLMNEEFGIWKDLPLFRHRLHCESAFTPEALVQAVQRQRELPHTSVPPVCVLDFDGDLTDWLIQSGIASIHATWACFHTTMFAFEIDGMPCGIVPRTIGGPYTVLVAEQLVVSGAHILLGLTSAGRIDTRLPLPSLVVATDAIRDEGTSFHYLAPAEIVAAEHTLVTDLVEGLRGLDIPVSRGRLWTTDAPYRETLEDIAENAARGALAADMQAASLFAFAQARGVKAGVVAHLTNVVDSAAAATNQEQDRDRLQFDKGTEQQAWDIVKAMCRSVRACIRSAS